MKKLICLLLALVSVMSLVACGSYTEGTTAVRESTSVVNPDDVDPNDELTSTVTLSLDGRPIMENAGFYMMFMELDIYAQWSNGHTTVIAQFDAQGVAMCNGLDGDYQVTLLSKKKGQELDTSSAFSQTIGDYTYNINGHVTTNDNRRIELPMYRILFGQGPGTNYMYPFVHEFSDQGVYKITVESPDTPVICRFAPGVSGVYTIESWVSAQDDNINPTYGHWYGTVAWAVRAYEVEDGGAEGIYTKNFKVVRECSEDEIGNVFIFDVCGTSKNNQYPIEIYVSVLKTAEMDERYAKTWMMPEDPLLQCLDTDGKFSEYWTKGTNGRNILDASKCKLWAKEDGGDGYYHIFDLVEYASTGGWGPTLYAQIKTSTIAGYSLHDLEWQGQGNNMLNLMQGNTFLDYKHFIEGFESMATNHGGDFVGTALCVDGCPCHDGDYINACLDGCETCSKDCTTLPPERYGTPGYAEAVNSDGLYPVTEELKFFLQLFAECHNLFCDGEGELEKKGLDADQASMWLWAVGTYDNDQGGLCQLVGNVVPNYFDK